jgi:ATP-binding cassette subfamily F protein 2
MPTRKDKKKKQQQQQQQQKSETTNTSTVANGKEEVDVETSSTSSDSPAPTLKTDLMIAKSLVKDRAPLEENITCTGTLTSHPLSRDIKIENFTLALYGKELIKDATLEFNWGRRYGLLGSCTSHKPMNEPRTITKLHFFCT